MQPRPPDLSRSTVDNAICAQPTIGVQHHAGLQADFGEVIVHVLFEQWEHSH